MSTHTHRTKRPANVRPIRRARRDRQIKACGSLPQRHHRFACSCPALPGTIFKTFQTRAEAVLYSHHMWYRSPPVLWQRDTAGTWNPIPQHPNEAALWELPQWLDEIGIPVAGTPMTEDGIRAWIAETMGPAFIERFIRAEREGERQPNPAA